MYFYEIICSGGNGTDGIVIIYFMTTLKCETCFIIHLYFPCLEKYKYHICLNKIVSGYY
jgi:hypothetical protein